MIQRIAVVLGVGIAGAVLAKRIRMPGGTFLGAMLASAIWSLAVADSQSLPPVFRSASMVLLGISLGSSLDREALLRIRRVLPLAMVLILALVGASLAVGWMTYARSPRGISIMTVLLGTMPGGASAMTAAAYDLDAQPSLVAAMHSIRQFIVFGLLPLLLRWFARSGQKQISHRDHE